MWIMCTRFRERDDEICYLRTTLFPPAAAAVTSRTRPSLQHDMTPYGNVTTAFFLVYFTFFLDNVLLTILVPIIPDWIDDESLFLWSQRDGPLAAMMNQTGGSGERQATVGLVLGAKAGAQIVTAASGVTFGGGAKGLRFGGGLLAAAAGTFAACGAVAGPAAAVCVTAGRILHGAGAALSAVCGLSLIRLCSPPQRRDRILAALLTSTALGVLVGYPFGGFANACWPRPLPFILIAGLLLLLLSLQYCYLKEDYIEVDDNESSIKVSSCGHGMWWNIQAAAASGAGRCAGSVFLTTTVTAALEPCLPTWIQDRYRVTERWAAGAVLCADSIGYAVGTAGGAGRGIRTAVVAQLVVGVSAVLLPHASRAAYLAGPQLFVGAGLGTLDACVVPALLSKCPRDLVLQRAGLLQLSSAAAYAAGPVFGGILSWCFSFETMIHLIGVLNILYCFILFRALTENSFFNQEEGADEYDEAYIKMNTRKLIIRQPQPVDDCSNDNF